MSGASESGQMSPGMAAPSDMPVAQMSPAQIQEQITQLQQDLDNVKQVQAETSGALKGTTIVYDAAPRFTDSSGITFKVRGRVLLDDVSVNIDNRGAPRRSNYSSNNLRPRQLFIGVEGTIGSKFAYKLEGGSRNGAAWAWDDAILEYKVLPDTSLIFGNQKSVSLENITSTRFTTFMDRGPFNALLGIDYALGVGAVKSGPNYSIWGAVLGQSVNSADVTAAAYGGSHANEQLAGTIRGTFVPINEDTRKLYFGAWGRYRSRGGQAGFNYAGNYVSNYNPVTLYQTGAVGDSDFTVAVEGLYIDKSLSVQGEFANVSVDRVRTGRDLTLGGPNFDFQTGYAFVSYFLTGEQRNLNVRGEIGRTTVLRPIDNGGMGAFEVAARVDYADLSDMGPNSIQAIATQYNAPAGISTAGKFVGGTIGLNWYPISYVRFMANYTHGDVANRDFGPLATRVNRDASVDVFQVRAQLDY